MSYFMEIFNIFKYLLLFPINMDGFFKVGYYFFLVETKSKQTTHKSKPNKNKKLPRYLI